MIASTPATDIYNLDVLNALPEGLNKIIEIGTGTGALAREILKKYPNITYIGVEISEEYLQSAKAYCTRTYLENFELPSEKLWAEVADSDCIIFADVLEHFIDPGSVLTRLRNRMRSKCKIIACIPNIQHWSIQFRLMIGDFRYAKSGLLDKTHLRFFTRSTILELFSESGFEIEKITPRIFAFQNQEIMLSKIKEISVIYGIDPNISVNDAAAYQYVVIASA